MKETGSMVVRSSSSYGVQSVQWSFSSDSASDNREADPPLQSTGAQFEGLTIDASGLVLLAGSSQGTLETDPMDAPAFDWIVPWWNADTAGAGSFDVFLKVETAIGWSRWYSMGSWSRVSSSSSDEDDIGKVETDTLILTAKAHRFRLKIELSAGGESAGAIIIARMGVISRDRGKLRSPARPHFLQEKAIKVPARSQMIEALSIRGRICSPTSAAMALEALGVKFPTSFVAADCYDSGAKIYGNWPFNVASLWRLGAVARLEFFSSMEAAVGELFAGHLLIASIKFAEGQLTGSPISKTNGHLVLITGLQRDDTGSWQVLVNDPAAASPEEVPRHYDLGEFEKAWTGVAYVVEGKR